MNTRNDETTLVIGGGKTGRRVAQRLTARGVPVKVGSRSGTTLFDWENPSTWRDALRDVRAMYVTYHPDIAAPGASEAVRAVSKLAVDRGVAKIVLLSGRGEPQVVPSEDAVRESGARFTIVRAAWFCQNFSEGLFLDPIRGGELAFPGGSVGEPFVDADDIADVVVEALTDDRHAGKTYDLTGPRLLSFAEAVAEIARVSGRTVRYVPVTSEQYAAALAPHMPAEQVTFLCDLFRYVLDGHNAHTTDDVQRILGRKPRDFHEFALAAATAWK